MTKSTQIRVMIVDDHPVVREGIARIISNDKRLELVGEAGSAQEAIELYRKTRPDITLMDMRLPDKSGVQTIETIREDFANARIIILSSFDHEEDIYQAIQAGARGYLLKDSPRNDLISAIIRVHSGERCIPAQIATRLAERVGANELTSREFEVLRLIVKGNSNKEIGDQLGISEGTVKSHVNNILSKLNVTDRTQAVSVALKRGLVHLE